MTSVEVREILKKAGWHEKTFEANGVVAMNPMYEDFSLGISARWHNGGWIPEKLCHLYIYPTYDTLKETIENA